MSYVVALVLTLAIEVPIAVGLTPAGSRRRMWIDAALLNLFTHPLLTVGLRWNVWDFWSGEALVWLAEAVGYALVSGLRPGRAVLISTVCNGITVILALLLGA